jgi:phenylpropionate dioxygenase-like ring-hydroxylating dioxygenase large terminal subunit
MSVKIAQRPGEDSAAQEELVAGSHTLPSSWWFSQGIFELEKRAVFSKSWLYTAHTSTFKKTGDYYAYNFMGMQFFLIKNKEGQIKAFHNICRHRAYPVVRKQKGSSAVLGCLYHGWSYNTDGNLTKAPQFDNVTDFNKTENGLYPIHTYVTDQGLIFVNFDNSPEGPMPFEEFFKGLEEEFHEFDFSDYEYHMSYELDGEFNWKTLMDGYMECYHCPTAHPGLSQAFQMNTYNVIPRSRHARHFCEIKRSEQKPEPKKEESKSWFGFGKPKEVEEKAEKNVGGEFDGLWMYLFPTNGINCYSPAWYSIRVLPISPSHTILQYDIFTKKGLPEADKKEFVEFLQQVEIEDFDLCVKTQKNLNQGVYSTGFLHPQKERGVVFYQNLVKDMVKEHFAKEKELGQQINPAKIGADRGGEETDELEQICQSLECQGTNPETFAKELNW